MQGIGIGNLASLKAEKKQGKIGIYSVLDSPLLLYEQ